MTSIASVRLVKFLIISMQAEDYGKFFYAIVPGTMHNFYK